MARSGLNYLPMRMQGQPVQGCNAPRESCRAQRRVGEREKGCAEQLKGQLDVGERQ